MAAAALQPFKSKAEERSRAPATDPAKSDPPGGKRVGTAYDKQIQNMEGDVSLLKDWKHARAILQKHIDHVKWALCAFSTEQLKGQRWMVGSSPKNCPAELKKALTVSEQSQVMHFRLVIQCFNDNCRRVRASSRAPQRWASGTSDSHCDVACMYSAILDEARSLSSWTSEKEQAVMKAFFQRDYMAEIEAAVVAKLSTWKLQHLGIWVDLIEPPSTPVKVATASELMELEDEAQSARFREVRTKLSADTAAMCEYNSAKEETRRRSHVVKVMHEKSQVEAGKEQVLQEFPAAIAEKDFCAWKKAQPPMDKQGVRYKKDVGAEDLPRDPVAPTLKLCQLSADGKLSIPKDIRQHFLTCPLFGPEWREIVKQFDADWGVVAAAAPSPPASSGNAAPATPASSVKTEAKVELKKEGFDWANVFPNSPTTLGKLKEKFPTDLTETCRI
eukprot:Skav235312  [mRNA]  locus=scaffold520:364384:369888:+ [translate_table: standard]